MIKKVRFKDELYWLAPCEIYTHEFNLSPLDHYNENGELLANAFSDISYAIVEYDGKIMRFHQQIGHISELEYVND